VTEDTSELVQVHLSLQTLAKYDTLGTLTGIINQIISGDEQTRSRSFQYLSGKFIKLGSEVITKEVEDFMISELKKILQVSCLPIKWLDDFH
jgi:Apoptosis inhibitory protein 5 (API5)